MQLSAQNSSHVSRLWSLFDADPSFTRPSAATPERKRVKRHSRHGLSLYLHQSGLPIPRVALIGTSLLCAAAVALMLSPILSPTLLPFFALGALTIPFGLLEGRVRARAIKFSDDYASMLMATASTIKVGKTIDEGLERAISLLEEESLVKKELERFLSALKRGIPKEEAIVDFGSTIRQPDLKLFRAAYLLVRDSGGRFGPTLARLAEVSQDRQILIKRAFVSTATMRMVANTVLIITPLVLWGISGHSDDYWQTLLHQHVANTVASVGLFIIGIGYFALRHMSNFKP